MKALGNLGQAVEGNYGVSASAFGLRVSQELEHGKLYFKPMGQFTIAKVNAFDFKVGQNANAPVLQVSQEPYTSKVVGLGLEVGSQLSDRATWYGNLMVMHEFGGNTEASYVHADGSVKKTQEDGKETWGELTLGGKLQVKENVAVYADVNKSIGHSHRDNWGFRGGVNVHF